MPWAVIQDVVRQMPMPQLRTVKELVEGPQVQPYETIAPVLRLQVQEDIVPVPRVILQEIVCDVPGPQFRTVEKVMEVPIIIIKSEEVVVEKRVPKPITAWVEKVMEVEQVMQSHWLSNSGPPSWLKWNGLTRMWTCLYATTLTGRMPWTWMFFKSV